MGWKLTKAGYVQDKNANTNLRIPTAEGLFSEENMIKKLYNMCWSVARLATKFGKTKQEIERIVK